MKIKVKDALEVHALLSNAKTDKLKEQEHIVVVKAIISLRPAVDEYNKKMEEATKRLSPDGLDGIIEKESRNEPRTPEELQKVMKFNAAMSECMSDEREREVELPVPVIAEETLIRLAASNPDMRAGQTAYLVMKLCHDAGSSADESAVDNDGPKK